MKNSTTTYRKLNILFCVSASFIACCFFPISVSAQSPVEFTEAWFDGLDDMTASLARGDMDGDGDLDLAVGNLNQVNRIYENDGSGGFVEIPNALGSDTYGANSVHVGNYARGKPCSKRSCCRCKRKFVIGTM